MKLSWWIQNAEWVVDCGVCGVMSVDVFVRTTVLSSELNASVVDCIIVLVDVFVRGTVVLSSELNSAVLDCVVVLVDVFVRGTVIFCGELNVSVGNCIVLSVQFVGVTVMLSSGLNGSVVVFAGSNVAVHLSPFCWRKSDNCFCS